MTLLPLTTPVRRARAVPVADGAVPAPRPSTGASPVSDLLSAPDAAQRALSGARGSGSDRDRDAIAWISAHLAWLDRVIYPSADRHLHAAAEVRAQRAATHRLALLVRHLHAEIDGDGGVPLADVPALRTAVLAALRDHSANERDLLARLREQLTAPQWAQLTGRYAERLQRGPTRPHPHTPRSGAPGRVAYRLSTWADRLLDVLDSRVVRPVPAASDVAAA